MSRHTFSHALFALVLLFLLPAIIGCAAATPTATTVPTAAPALPANGTPPATYWPTNGWRTASPASQGIDGAQLDAAVEYVRQSRLALHSLLVIRNGYMVSETYFPGYTADTRHTLYSVTKSFVSTLVGIAIDKGYIIGVDKPVQDFFPGKTFANPSAQKQGMTLENLLTMTSGLEWGEADADFRDLYYSSDWVKFMMDKPLVTDPGSKFRYCSGCSHLLSAIVQNATKMNTKDFADKELLRPLGITNYAWETDSSGIPIGGWGIEMTPRDFAKLGYLYLHNGEWEGQQVVSAQWVKAATARHVPSDSNLGYGYQWWTYPSYGAYMALGREGQTIFVVPDQNLIIVTTAGLGNHDPIFQLIDQYLMPAVQKM